MASKPPYDEAAVHAAAAAIVDKIREALALAVREGRTFAYDSEAVPCDTRAPGYDLRVTIGPGR